MVAMRVAGIPTAFKFTAWCMFTVVAQSYMHHSFDLAGHPGSHLKKSQPKPDSNFLSIT